MSDRLPGEPGGMLAGFAEGSQIAGYRLEEQVGAGGMAVVFRAHDERLGRRVALKILAPAMAADEEFRQRFVRESRAAAAVDDPHIIPVFEAGDAAGVLFIAMRYVPGGDVRSLMRRVGPLVPGRAAAIVSSVASALDAAHGAGLVHRDVKPANMLMDVRPGRPDHVYLSDFGLSKGALSLQGLTASGQFLGTPGYSAPEQIQGKPIDGRADQYSLACAAFELLSGAPPFPRDQATAVIWAHMSDPPPPLTSRCPGLPTVVDGVMARALAKAPADRYPSCREFADALRAALGLDPYDPGSGTKSDTGTPHRPARPEARHARAGVLSHPGTSSYAGTAPSLAPAAGPAPGTQPPAAAGNAQSGPPHPESADRPGPGPTRRKLLLGAVACSTAAGLGLAWDLNHHGAAHGAGRQRSHRDATKPGPGTTIWQADLSFTPRSGVFNLIPGGSVLYAQGATEIFALRTSDGTPLWKYKAGGNEEIHGRQVPGSGGIRAVAASQGAVYLSSGHQSDLVHNIYALRSGDGKTLWTRTLRGDVVAATAETVYVGAESDDAFLYALQASDGAQIWKSSTEIFEAPAVSAGIVYAFSGFKLSLLYALQASDGKQIWSVPVRSNQGQLAAGGNTICALPGAGPAFSGSGPNFPSPLQAYRAGDGKPLWRTDANGGFVSVAIAGNVIYAVSGSSELFALDASDGKKIWGYPASTYTVPAISKGLVYAIGAGGGVVALHASNGKPAWHSSAYSTAGPVVGPGAVYIADIAKIYALRD